MPKRSQVFTPRGARTAQQVDRDRGSARERGYSAAWDRASAAFLAANPLCQYCELEGRVEPAALTDHLYPHRVHRGVFWVQAWWVASCTACHSGFKQALERAGRVGLDRLAHRLGRPTLDQRAQGVGG